MSAFGFRLILLSTVANIKSVVVVDPSVPVTPVITRDGTPGTSPFSWTIANDDSYHEGYYWNVQRATSTANLLAGTFNANIIQQVKASDLYGDPIVFDELGSTPIGDLALRVRIGHDDGVGGYIWSNWSNILTDTIAASYTATFDDTKVTNDATLSADKRTLTSKNLGYQSAAKAAGTSALSAPIGYFEVTFVQSFVTPDRAYPYGGLVPVNWNKNTDGPAVSYYQSGALFVGGGFVGQYSGVAANGGTLGFIVHKNSGKFWVRTETKWEPGVPSFDVNGNITGDPGFSSGITSFLGLASCDGGDQIRIGFGQESPKYSLPANVPPGFA